MNILWALLVGKNASKNRRRVVDTPLKKQLWVTHVYTCIYEVQGHEIVVNESDSQVVVSNDVIEVFAAQLEVAIPS